MCSLPEAERHLPKGCLSLLFQHSRYCRRVLTGTPGPRCQIKVSFHDARRVVMMKGSALLSDFSSRHFRKTDEENAEGSTVADPAALLECSDCVY